MALSNVVVGEALEFQVGRDFVLLALPANPIVTEVGVEVDEHS